MREPDETRLNLNRLSTSIKGESTHQRRDSRDPGDNSVRVTDYLDSDQKCVEVTARGKQFDDEIATSLDFSAPQLRAFIRTVAPMVGFDVVPSGSGGGD